MRRTLPVTACGKELLQGDRHLADCRDQAAATAIALMLNSAVLILPSEDEVRIARAGLGEIL